MPESPDLLAQRVARLENDLRRVRQVGLVAFATIAVAIGLVGRTLTRADRNAKPVAGITESQAFILRDRDNNARAELAMEDDGSAALRMFDTAGRERVRLGVDPSGRSRLTFSDEERTRLWMAQEDDGRTHLRFNDRVGAPRLDLDVDKEGAPALVMMDPKGVIRAGFGVDGETIPALMLRGKDGRSRASFSVPAQGAVLGLTDNDGNVSFQAPPPKVEDAAPNAAEPKP